jgi:hypothetical protein
VTRQSHPPFIYCHRHLLHGLGFVTYSNSEFLLTFCISSAFVRIFWKGVRATSGVYVHWTTQHRNTRTNIHALGGIEATARVSKLIWPTPRGCCDQPSYDYPIRRSDITCWFNFHFPFFPYFLLYFFFVLYFPSYFLFFFLSFKHKPSVKILAFSFSRLLHMNSSQMAARCAVTSCKVLSVFSPSLLVNCMKEQCFMWFVHLTSWLRDVCLTPGSEK